MLLMCVASPNSNRVQSPSKVECPLLRFDGLNRRIRRTVSNASSTVIEKQRFLYDTNVMDASFDEVVMVLDELVSGESYQKVDHRFLNGPEIDQVFADETPGDSVLWYLSDQ